MEGVSNKRTLDSFFAPTAKKVKIVDVSGGTDVDDQDLKTSTSENENSSQFSRHSTYPFPISHLPAPISSTVNSLPSTIGKAINDQPDLDLLYFQPYIPKYLERQLFEFFRRELPFYRVEYKINRGNIETQISTPRYTTVFGIDETSKFTEDGLVVDSTGQALIQKNKFYTRYPPRPIPKCLDDLRLSTEVATGCRFNFCLVNYYASGADSIAYHSDDERFLGPFPAVASFSLGAKRDFLMKHKPSAPDGSKLPTETAPIKLSLGSGEMILMKGKTQPNWLHSVPKRSGKNKDDGGRINITFRKALIKAGTDNYYNYNVGTGPVYRWAERANEMRLWVQKM